MGDQASERNETQRNAMQYNVTALSGRTGAIGEGEKSLFCSLAVLNLLVPCCIKNGTVNISNTVMIDKRFQLAEWK